MSRYQEGRGGTNTLVIVVSVFLGCFVLGGGCYAFPKYNVWQQGLAGQAELKRAEQNRQIKIQEARAIKESAKDLAEAEVIRAGGVAKAQEIINQTLTARYIQWLMAESMSEQTCDVRYIPTEANLPILEARQ
jgi:predicted Holliday junction resolvase-like endonuclease